MIPKQQTKFSNSEGVHGNCFVACIASLLEVEIEDVPAFEDMGDEWHTPFIKYLVSRGYDFMGTTRPNSADMFTRSVGVDGYFIVGGGSPRGWSRGHAVIYKDGVLAHDPHPSGEGITELWHCLMIERASPE